MSNKNDDIPDFLKGNPDQLVDFFGADPSSAIEVAASALNEEDYEEEELPVPVTDDELWDWVKKYLNIEIPRNACCSAHSPPFKAFSDAYFARHPRVVWYASRGFGGKSAMLSALALTEGLTLGAAVTLLGGSGEQAQRVLQYMKGRDTNMVHSFMAAPEAPRWMIRGDPTKRKTFFKNGGWIDALMASATSVHGPHPQRLRGDEIDDMERKLWDAAQGQPMESRGIREQVVGSSTWYSPTGNMTEEFKLAAEMGFPVYEWCYRCNLKSNGGWLNDEVVERKKASIPTYMWDIEYELQEPLTEGQAFDSDSIEVMFDKELGHYPGKLNSKQIIEGPVEGATYATGGDWAKSRDRTWIVTLRTDEVPHRVVAFAHLGRIPFPDMVAEFNKQVKLYDSYAVHDKTGIGSVIHDYLEVFSEGIDMVGKRRNKLFSEYIAGVERREIVSPLIDSMYNDHKYCLVDDLYGGPASHPPDSVVCMALAYEASDSLELLI